MAKFIKKLNRKVVLAIVLVTIFVSTTAEACDPVIKVECTILPPGSNNPSCN